MALLSSSPQFYPSKEEGIYCVIFKFLCQSFISNLNLNLILSLVCFLQGVF